MRDLAVVALEEVLAAHLPVRLVLPLGPVVEPERAHVEAGVGEQLGQLADRLPERSCA